MSRMLRVSLGKLKADNQSKDQVSFLRLLHNDEKTTSQSTYSRKPSVALQAAVGKLMDLK